MSGLREILGHDRDAVRAASEVFAEHGRFIRSVIRFQIHDESRVEDLYQEFFLYLVRTPLPSDVRNVRSYLFRALIHDAVDMSRRLEKYHRCSRIWVR